VQKALKLANNKSKIVLVNIILKDLDKVEDKKIMMKWKYIVDSTIKECVMFNSFMNEVTYYSERY
jgi:hypothetical protein